jgi:hypothetical protein
MRIRMGRVEGVKNTIAKTETGAQLLLPTKSELPW